MPPTRAPHTHPRSALCPQTSVRYELPRPVWSRTVRAEWNQSGYCVGSEKKEDLQGLLCPAATRTVLFSGETRGTAGPQPSPVVLGCLTVGPLSKEGVKQSLSVVARCLVKGLGHGQARRWCGSGESELFEGASRTGASCTGSLQSTMFNLSKRRVERGKTAWRRCQANRWSPHSMRVLVDDE